MSRRPTGYRRSSDGISSTTVVRPCGSRAVETTPAGLLTAYTRRSGIAPTGRPPTAMASCGPTSSAGSKTGDPFTVTRPSPISASAARREATPADARYLASRIPCHHRHVDLTVIDSKLEQLGEPLYRARQVWRWAAQGAP